MLNRRMSIVIRAGVCVLDCLFVCVSPFCDLIVVCVWCSDGRLVRRASGERPHRGDPHSDRPTALAVSATPRSFAQPGLSCALTATTATGSGDSHAE